MVVAKINASQFISSYDIEQEHQFIDQINEKMKQLYSEGEHFSVGSIGFKNAVINKVIASYEIAGWTVDESYHPAWGRMFRFS